jgi:threonine dehydratase
MPARRAPELVEIEAARERLAGVARETPVYSSETFSRLTGREVWLKAENLQRTGSFKVRGAYNRISTLTKDERRAGVIAASAGNHGQAVAWAAREAECRATIFVPQDAPMTKVEATRAYAAEVVLGGEGFEETMAQAQAHAERSGGTFVHAFEDPRVIAGQGTIGLELAEQLPQTGTFVIPVGGGGLAAGIALALRARRPGVRIVGVRAQPGFTIADGIMVKHPGELTMRILGKELDDLVSVDDEEISEALVLCLERTKLVVEGAGAAGLAALLASRVGGVGPVAVVLSGGNIDATLLMSVVRHGLTRAGRYLVLSTLIPDRPGELTRLLELVAEHRGNIVSVRHHREGMHIHVTQTEVELTLVTRDEKHCREIVGVLEEQGYPVERVG